MEGQNELIFSGEEEEILWGRTIVPRKMVNIRDEKVNSWVPFYVEEKRNLKPLDDRRIVERGITCIIEVLKGIGILKSSIGVAYLEKPKIWNGTYRG